MRHQPLWTIFSFLFLGLALFHFIQSFRKIEKIKNKAQVKSIMGVNLGINEFISDFNNYIESINRDNQKMNVIAGIGYIAALLTSAYSYYLSSL